MRELENISSEGKMTKFNDIIKDYISNVYNAVGDLSSHPIMEEMEKIAVGAGHVSWIEPKGEGFRTSLVFDKVADREKVEE